MKLQNLTGRANFFLFWKKGGIFVLNLNLMKPLTLCAVVNHMLFSFSPLGVSPLKVQMPALSPTMEVGNIVKWLKKEGKESTLTEDFIRKFNRHSSHICTELLCQILNLFAF